MQALGLASSRTLLLLLLLQQQHLQQHLQQRPLLAAQPQALHWSTCRVSAASISGCMSSQQMLSSKRPGGFKALLMQLARSCTAY
jgi:hypothetical protein